MRAYARSFEWLHAYRRYMWPGNSKQIFNCQLVASSSPLFSLYLSLALSFFGSSFSLNCQTKETLPDMVSFGFLHEQFDRSTNLLSRFSCLILRFSSPSLSLSPSLYLSQTVWDVNAKYSNEHINPSQGIRLNNNVFMCLECEHHHPHFSWSLSLRCAAHFWETTFQFWCKTHVVSFILWPPTKCAMGNVRAVFYDERGDTTRWRVWREIVTPEIWE